MRRRRTAATLVSSGLVCLAAGVLPALMSSATADAPEPGSGLGSFSLNANAPVLQVRQEDPAHQCSAAPASTAGCEGVVNETVSQLSNGPIAHALSSVTWPGTLGGNLGSLLVTASNGAVPQEATVLNSPVRAEADIGDKKPVVTDYPPAPAPPAIHMEASATASKVSAIASTGGAHSLPVGGFSTSSSRTTTELTGVATARAVAHSEAKDITIGVLHLGSVVSDAVATTDGVAAKVSGRTVVTGASVAGFPVSIDQDGITVVTQNVPFPAAAEDAVNTALAKAGMSVALSAPHGTPTGGSVAYDAGSLVLFWQQQPGTALSAVLGGAQVSVQASPGFGCLFNCGPGGGTGGTTGGVAAPPPVTPPLGSPTTGDVAPPTVAGPGPQVGQPIPQAFHGKLPGGLSPWLGALSFVGAVLVMAGLRRLPDRVLAASSSTCPNGDLS